MTTSPLLSIITPTYNRGDVIDIAIQSVYSQGIDCLELIIMDGGSTDNTASIISKYPQIRYYSEKDEGLYFALNKGISLARGKYIGWLNSDDYYNTGALQSLLEALLANPNFDAAFGYAEVISADPAKPHIRVPRSLSTQMGFLNQCVYDCYPINSGIFKRTIFSELDGFDTAYTIAADKDFLFRYGLKNFSYTTVDKVVCFYQNHSSSLTFNSLQNSGNIKGLVEEMSIALTNENRSTEKSTKALCHFWFLSSTANLAIMELSNKKFRSAYNFSLTGLNHDWKWIMIFSRLFVMSIIRKIVPAPFLSKFSKFRFFFSNY